MKLMRALMWVSVGVAALGLPGCGLFGGGRPADVTVYSAPEEPDYIVVRQAPPPLVVEVRPLAPSVAHVWIDGYWNWHDQYAWVRGCWAVPPHEHIEWVAASYESHPRGYRYAPGHWRDDRR